MWARQSTHFVLRLSQSGNVVSDDYEQSHMRQSLLMRRIIKFGYFISWLCQGLPAMHLLPVSLRANKNVALVAASSTCFFVFCNQLRRLWTLAKQRHRTTKKACHKKFANDHPTMMWQNIVLLRACINATTKSTHDNIISSLSCRLDHVITQLQVLLNPRPHSLGQQVVSASGPEIDLWEHEDFLHILSDYNNTSSPAPFARYTSDKLAHDIPYYDRVIERAQQDATVLESIKMLLAQKSRYLTVHASADGSLLGVADLTDLTVCLLQTQISSLARQPVCTPLRRSVVVSANTSLNDVISLLKKGWHFVCVEHGDAYDVVSHGAVLRYLYTQLDRAT